MLARAPVIMELICDSASEEVANHLFWIVTDILRQTVFNVELDTMVTLATAGVLSMVDDYNKKYGLTPADIHAWVAILPMLPVVPQETPTRREFVQSMYTGVENRDPSQSQRLQNLREPLLQFSVQSLPEYSLESALEALQILRNAYPSAVVGDRQEKVLSSPHTVVLMDV
jgi:hypothetical protein